MGYYYNDPSGLGAWYVNDEESPRQAFDRWQEVSGATFSPLLEYSVINNPQAQHIDGGRPNLTPTPIKPNSVPATPKAGILQSSMLRIMPLTGIDRPVQPTSKAGFVGGGSGGGPGFDNPESDCDPGYYWDAFNDVCVPVDVLSGPFIPPINNQPGYVTVNIQNAVQISASAIASVTKAVKDGIEAGADAATDVATQAATQVTKSIGGLVDAINGGVNNLFDGIKNGLNYVAHLIGDNIGALIKFITEHVGDIISTVRDVINNVIVPAINTVTAVISKIDKFIETTVEPIFNTIARIYQQTNALIEAIHKDVQHGIEGILQLPQDISQALGTIEAALARVLGQVGTKNSPIVLSTVHDGKESSFHDLFKGLGGTLTTITGADKINTTFHDQIKLPEPTITQAGAATFDAIWKEIEQFVHSLIHGGTGSVDALKTSFGTLPFLLGNIVDVPAFGVAMVGALVSGMLPLFYFLKGDISGKAGLEKLGQGEALRAWLRGFIADADLHDELKFEGYNDQRIKVIKDLTTYLIDQSASIEMYLRGIVTEKDMRDNLKAHGVTDAEQNALIAKAYVPFDITVAEKGWRYAQLTDEQLMDVLADHRWKDHAKQLLVDTLLQREGVNDLIMRHKFELLYSSHLATDSFFNTLPGDVQEAAKRDGLGPQVAYDRWLEQMHVPGIEHWISLYFRGIRTRSELTEIFKFYRIPDDWHDDVIQAHRALIPWRTIPTMLSLNLVTEAYAKQHLLSHGYDLPAAEALLKYATAVHPHAASGASGDLHGLSVAVAKGYYELGTITIEDYKHVLMSHGYDEHTADLAVKVETEHAAMLHRKQIAEDIKAEVLAGTIDLDNAVVQMDLAHFSATEKSKVINAVHKTKRQVNKIPTEPELHTFAKIGIIDVDTYRETMKQLGWADKWVDAFTIWRFPDAT